MTYEQYLSEVKKGILMDNGLCPVTPLLLMLQGKWKAQICYALCIHDVVRFGMLKRELPGITNTMLTSSLRELERDGLITRRQHDEMPPRVEYSFTALGDDLKPIFYQIMLRGFRHEKELEKYAPACSANWSRYAISAYWRFRGLAPMFKMPWCRSRKETGHETAV